MEEALDYLRYALGVLKRRWWVILIPTVIGGVLATTVAMVIPPVYQSTARILVESQQIPQDLARSTVTVNAAQSVNFIEQRLTTRQNLLDLADRFDVFAGREDLSPTERVQEMRAAIRFASASAGRRRSRNVTSIEIGFSANDPQIAADVANALLTQLLEQNVEQRSAQASETLEFFTNEVRRFETELTQLENRIALFKQENADALPGSLALRRNTIDQLEQSIADGARRSLELQQRRQELENRIELGLGAAPDDTGRGTPLERELASLRTTLAQRRAILSDTHPTIRSLQARIAALEQTAFPESAADTDAPGERAPSQAVQLVSAIEQIDAELTRIADERDEAEARIAQLEASIARTPEIELELRSLERDYSVAQARYQEALRKQADAETGERLEVNQQAERLEVIEQPQAPDSPVSPNRVFIAGAGSAVSIALGLGLAVLLEILNPALRTARDLERALDIRPLMTIPYIRTQAELARRRWLIRIAVLVVLAAPPLALFLVDRFVLPLPVLVEELLERTGLDTYLNLISSRLGG